jgi:hypothetical protein
MQALMRAAAMGALDITGFNFIYFLYLFLLLLQNSTVA